ncbi:MAG TPA: TetR/AcrR family transcriptional regulator [Actinocrinis sp.]|nr:TetR/AcrR family transcriptional regulator [Actinocrinis sp.]
MTDAAADPAPGSGDAAANPRAAQAERKRARTRQRLLRATFALLGRQDGWNTQIDDIVKEAGTGRGTFYNYFDSRAQLLDVMAYELNHGLNVAVAEAPDPVTRTCWAVRVYVRKAERDHHWGWAMVNLGVNGQQPFGEDTYRSAVETLADGMASGDFTLANQRVGLDLVLGTGIHAIQTVCEGYGGPGYAEDVTRAVLLGLGVDLDRAQQLVAAPLPAVDIGRSHLWAAELP